MSGCFGKDSEFKSTLLTSSSGSPWRRNAQAEAGTHLCECFVFSQPQHASVVFFVVVVLFCTGVAEEWTPACGGTVALRMSTESLLLCRAEWAAEQFIPDRKTVCRVCSVSSSQRLPHGYTAPLTASVCLWARWQASSQREMKADSRIRSCIELRHVIPSNGFISLVHYLSQFVAYVCQTEGTLSSLQMFHSDTKTTQ